MSAVQMESSRKKSCKQCRIAKTRCSLDSPRCSRCQNRKLPCKYENPNPKPTVNPSRHGPLLHSWRVTTDPALLASETLDTTYNQSSQVEPLPISRSASTPAELFDFNISPAPTLDDDFRLETDWQSSGLAWPTEMPQLEEVPRGLVMSDDVDQVRVLEVMDQDMQDGLTWLEFLSGSSSSALEGNTTQGRYSPARDWADAFSPTSLTINRRSNILQASWDVLRGTRDYTSSLFNRRSDGQVSSAITGNFLWATIKPIANGFVDGSLPPFIHRYCGTKERKINTAESADLPEALANCRTIVSMYLKRSPQNSSLVLKTLLLEIRRLYDEFRKYDKRILLQALQALTIYVIMIAADTNRCSLMSVILRIAMVEVATEVSRDGYLNAIEAQGSFPDWESWIQAESKRRTLIMLHLVAFLLNTDIGIPHPPGCFRIDAIPLPSNKMLWNADTRADWESEYDTYLSTRKVSRVLTIKTLRDSYRLDMGSAEADVIQDLSVWSEGVDEIGSMLLMALSHF